MTTTTFTGLLCRLVSSGDFRIIHERLASFSNSSYRNSCQENASFCFELIKLHATLQGQLFQLLELCCSEGGICGGSQVLINRLLPWLRVGSPTVRIFSKEEDTILEKYKWKVEGMQEDWNVSKTGAADVRLKLSQMKHQLESKESQLKQQFQEIIELKRENSELHERLHKYMLETVTATESYKGLSQTLAKPAFFSRSIQLEPPPAKLVERFSELYNDDRLKTVKALKEMPDKSVAERMIYFTVEECFRVSKTEQRKMRSRMKQALQTANLDEGEVQFVAVNDVAEKYTKKNIELHETEFFIPDVIKSLYRNSMASLHIPGNEKILVQFIREVLRVAWDLVSLDPPIDLPTSHEGDIIDETRYRRTYDSEFSASTVQYFVWPALVRDGSVVSKGEVVTKRLFSPRIRKVTTSTSSPGSAELFSSRKDVGFASLPSSWKLQSFEIPP
ncbi:mitochondria-eating protein-like [Acropora muricata]|uniref:mitochondria-eating protein-like n=1 Tax=Acropora muricata TaxID=159855 RepID=UPI0034E3A52C